jgi:hypothetical protein
VGGLGSGRSVSWLSGSSCKDTTEDYFNLDIREIKRHGLIAPDQQEVPALPA